MEKEFNRTEDLFPKPNRLKREYRELLSEHVFGGFRLQVDRHGAQKRLVLQQDTAGKKIPFLAWSAGQREFVPLLMGLYWLMPAAKMKQRGELEWVVIEELEMGLHPRDLRGAAAHLGIALARLSRLPIVSFPPRLGPGVGVRVIKDHGADPSSLLDVFDVRKSHAMKTVAAEALQKEARVYYFDRDGGVRDISNLDPGSEDAREADWGGLSEFSGRVAEVVASVVNTAGKGSGR